MFKCLHEKRQKEQSSVCFDHCVTLNGTLVRIFPAGPPGLLMFLKPRMP